MIKDKFLKINGYSTFNLKNYDLELYNKFLDCSFEFSPNEIKDNMIEYRISCHSTHDAKSLKEKIKNSLRQNSNIKEVYLQGQDNSLINNTFYSYNLSFAINSNEGNIQDVYGELLRIQELFLSDINQAWFQNAYFPDAGEEDEKLDNKIKMFQELTTKIVGEFYEVNLTDYLTHANWRLQETYFPKDTYIKQHADGQNPGRLCALLFYLSPEWKPGYGGELILGNNEVIIPPTTGNVVLLDFTENNIEHSVTNVNRDFGRFTYLTFFELK